MSAEKLFITEHFLKKELQSILKKNDPSFNVTPSVGGPLNWHFIINLGPSKSALYGQAQYHGVLFFPIEYPFKPPTIKMITPSGIFAPNTDLKQLMGISKENGDWKTPLNVIQLLQMFLDFMLIDAEIESTEPLFVGNIAGYISSTKMEKFSHASDTLAFNISNPIFKKVFPEEWVKLKERMHQYLVERLFYAEKNFRKEKKSFDDLGLLYLSDFQSEYMLDLAKEMLPKLKRALDDYDVTQVESLNSFLGKANEKEGISEYDSVLKLTRDQQELCEIQERLKIETAEFNRLYKQRVHTLQRNIGLTSDLESLESQAHSLELLHQTIVKIYLAKIRLITLNEWKEK